MSHLEGIESGIYFGFDILPTISAKEEEMWSSNLGSVLGDQSSNSQITKYGKLTIWFRAHFSTSLQEYANKNVVFISQSL